MALYPRIEQEQFTPYTASDGSTVTPGRFYIRIYDDASGQAATPSNMAVTYTRDANGSITQATEVLNGQSLLIYDGVVSSSGPTTYYVNFYINSYGAGTGGGTGGEVKITEIQVVNKADKNGFNATVTTIASGTFLPFRYFIDNIELPQTFSGLSYGNHTFKVIDAGGNEDTLTFYVPKVYDILVSTPAREVAPGKVSNWNAAFNPILFTYQRRDFNITSVENNAGRCVFHTQESLVGLNEADTVYVNAGPYQGTFTVLLASINSFMTAGPFSSDATGFMNSDTLRPYYKVNTEITYFDRDKNSFVTKNYFHSPNPSTGKTIADLSGVLRSIVRAKDDSQYNQININDTNLSNSYTVRYREVYDGFTGDWFSAGQAFYVTYSAMQVQSPFGGNIGQFVPFTGGSSARFVTDFKEPCYSLGYPFDLGFIYSDLMADGTFYMTIGKLDINRSAIAVPNNYQLQKGYGLNRFLFNQNYEDNVWYLKVNMIWDNGSKVTEDKIIRIDRAIDVNSVYVRWIGYSGSWEYYRFVWNQEATLNVQNSVTVSRYEYDYQNSQGTEETISREAAKGIKVFAEDLSVSDIKGMESLKVSPKVQWLASKSPMKWQTVIVATGSTTEYETQLGTYAYQLAFTLPAINVQTQ